MRGPSSGLQTVVILDGVQVQADSVGCGIDDAAPDTVDNLIENLMSQARQAQGSKGSATGPAAAVRVPARAQLFDVVSGCG